MNYGEESLRVHKEKKGKLAMVSKVPLATRDDLSIAYTPGVAAVSSAIAKDKSLAYEYTGKGNTVAIVTDGSAVLGLGNIGPEAALPVMEGKAVIFKEFAGIDAFPLCLATQDTEEIIQIVKNIAPGIGAVNLEDISAPRCFEIEERLQDIGIPVFHDDQHGTAVVVLAGIMNAAKAVGKNLSDLSVVISGAGVAAIAVTKLLSCIGADEKTCTPVRDIIVCDSKGIINQNRADLNPIKKDIASRTNISDKKGAISDALIGADVLVGVSAPGVITEDMIRSMAPKAIVFTLANPVPEILPNLAKEAGAIVVATGRSDFPNQVNNALAYPGIFKGAFLARAPRITPAMKQAAARTLASFVAEPSPENILPALTDKRVAQIIAEAVYKAARA
ncbi:MAG: NADP-dependent malic enzyme [Candidatus Lloydbacteria bacterium]|nr:NADP-dependent malic enzyme [Candidatus Lloydbacteria bacterium]